MNTKSAKKIAYFLVFSLVLGVAGIAYGAVDQSDTRYLVKSGSGFWKKSFGVRNEFKEGFTTDLSDWQLRVAKVFGLEITAVPKAYILQGLTPIEDISKNPEIEKGKPSPTPMPSPTPTPVPSPSIRPLPASQLPWGVLAVYGNPPLLTSTSGGADVRVAVLDTGVTVSHPDLSRRILECKDFTAPRYPVVDGKCEDKNGHGTHVAGVVAADGGADGLGVYGVAPEAGLYAYKVCGANGSCWSDDIAKAITTAADNGANIINMSLGSDVESSLIANAISYAVQKGVLIVAAAGNDGDEIGSIDYPGANASVVAVGAFDVNLDIPAWSSRGVNSTTTANVVERGDIEFAAPGVVTESTWKDGGYVIMSGTSMATPHVAGLAAKLWQKDVPVGQTSATATRKLLQEDFAQDLLPLGDDDASGFGFPHL